MDDEEERSAVIVEQTVLSIKECFVYKVPPLRTASGHRAEDWGLDSPIFTGFLRVFQADLKLRVAIYKYKDEKSLSSSDENLSLFGECPIGQWRRCWSMVHDGELFPFIWASMAG